MSYANFFEFGKSLNNNIKYVNDPANPLTYTIMANYNAQFNHGSTANYSRPWNAASSVYMKELANGWHGAKKEWNTYCQAYYKSNTQRRINLGAINRHAFASINTLSTPKNTVGQNLLRNALELHCVYYPSATFKKEQFDPNIANSPIIHIPHALCGNCHAIIYLQKHPNNNRIIKAVLKDPLACTDVLCYIWAAIFWPTNPYGIRLAKSRDSDIEPLTPTQSGSKLYKYLKSNFDYFKCFFNIIMKALGKPCHCKKCQTGCLYTFPNDHHNSDHHHHGKHVAPY